MALTLENDSTEPRQGKRLRKIFTDPKSVFEYKLEQTTDPEEDITFLQKQFHVYTIESISLDVHDLLTHYINFLTINQEFEPSEATLQNLIHNIRFDNVIGKIDNYFFLNEIEPSYHNFKLKRALNIFKKLYLSKLKDDQRLTEFNVWVDNLTDERV